MPDNIIAAPVYLSTTQHVRRVLASLALGFVPVGWLLATPGWPVNHESLRLFRRMGVTVGQWSLGHLLPIWSTTSFQGFGSPSPIIYHKVFSFLSSALLVLTGAPKIAICLAIILVLATACLGAALACRIMLGRADLLIEMTVGMLVVFSRYATADWLIRGAAAELCALALIVWLFAWCATLLRRGYFSLWIAPLMAAIGYAHSVMAICCIIPLGLAAGIAWWCWPAERWNWLRPAAISAAMAAALMAPVAVASLPYSHLASLGLARRVPTPGTPGDPDFVRYFYEPAARWGQQPVPFAVQIDLPLLILASLAALQLLRARGRHAPLLFLLAVAAVMLCLLAHWSLPFYRVVPMASWIQYTFRLLTFIVIALALCAAPVLQALRGLVAPGLVWGTACVLAVAMSWGKPWAVWPAAPLAFTSAQAAEALYSETNAVEPFEYVPRPWTATLPPLQAGQLNDPRTPCLGRPLDDMRLERAAARFAVHCPTGKAAVLPIWLAPGMRFEVASRPVAGLRLCPDGRAHVAITGDAVITVIYPDLPRAIWAALRPSADPALTCGRESPN